MRATAAALVLLVLLACVPAGATYIPPPATTVPTTTQAPIRVLVATTTTPVPAGGIAVNSTPAGASVTIDGVYRGKTPLIVRPLATGTHSLTLTRDGYWDYAASFTIAGSRLEQREIILNRLPAPTTTVTTKPAKNTTTVPSRTVTTVQPKTSTPRTPSRSPARNLSAALFPRLVSIVPLTIRVGNQTKSPLLTTVSPYFSSQIVEPEGSPVTPEPRTNLTSFVEVDAYNVYLNQSHLMTSAEMALDPVWGDEDTVYIAATDPFFNNTNFRWISAEPGVSGFYQISRSPFDANASRWQNQYVPGLVSSGPVEAITTDSDGFRYFRLNFAPIANHNPSDPPTYTGVGKLDETVPGKGTPMGMVRVPLTGIGIWTKKGSVGPISVPVPAGLAFLKPGERTEAELGNPNENLILASPGVFRNPTMAETMIRNIPQTFWVRVVPLYDNGSAGVPTLPVRVTVVRPTPCPPDAPADTTDEIVMRPPSAKVASFYMTLFVPDWIHTDDQGKLVSRAYFVTVTSPPYCSGSGPMDPALCTMYGGSEPGYHFYADPEEEHWYDTFVEIFEALFSAFSRIISAVSSAWSKIQAYAVKMAAGLISTLTPFDCASSPACTDLLSTGLSIAMTSLGVPPTIPNVADLENMGADYMARVAAEELGAGGVLDTAEAVYDSMPDDVQETIKDNSGKVGNNIADSLASETGAQTAAAAGNFYIPDPLWYKAHPATVIVRVSNPNSESTDRVTMTVKDSAGLYRSSKSIYVPPLGPGESTVIPVVLEEDYTNVYTADCNEQSYVTTCKDVCVPCFWKLWIDRVISLSKSGGDTFSVTFTAQKEGRYITLDPSSSGTVLSGHNVLVFDDQGKSCGAYNATTVLRYPGGWQMTADSLNRNLEDAYFAYTFTEGARGRLISE